MLKTEKEEKKAVKTTKEYQPSPVKEEVKKKAGFVHMEDETKDEKNIAVIFYIN